MTATMWESSCPVGDGPQDLARLDIHLQKGLARLRGNQGPAVPQKSHAMRPAVLAEIDRLHDLRAGDIDERQGRARLRAGAVVGDQGQAPIRRDGNLVRTGAHGKGGGDLARREVHQRDRGLGLVGHDQGGGVEGDGEAFHG
ncbi:MAG: hypothetical protein ACJ76J_10855 [Thermoanaerobaculia bacterium]